MTKYKSHIGEAIGPRVPLSLLTHAKTLNLHCNKISTFYVRIDASFCFNNLLELNLSSNRLGEMFDHFGPSDSKVYRHILDASPQLISLDIGANGLKGIGALFSIGQTKRCLTLQKLNLSRNYIKSIKGLEKRFPYLRVLDVSNNNISINDLPKFVSDLVLLRKYLNILCVDGNPFYKSKSSDEIILKAMKKGVLSQINRKEISPSYEQQQHSDIYNVINDNWRLSQKNVAAQTSYISSVHNPTLENKQFPFNDAYEDGCRVEAMNIGVQVYTDYNAMSTQTHHLGVDTATQTEEVNQDAISDQETQTEVKKNTNESYRLFLQNALRLIELKIVYNFYINYSAKLSFLSWRDRTYLESLKVKVEYINNFTPDICNLVAAERASHKKKEKKMKELFHQHLCWGRGIENELQNKTKEVSTMTKKYQTYKTRLKFVSRQLRTETNKYNKSKSIVRKLLRKNELLKKKNRELHEQVENRMNQDIESWKEDVRVEKHRLHQAEMECVSLRDELRKEQASKKETESIVKESRAKLELMHEENLMILKQDVSY